MGGTAARVLGPGAVGLTLAAGLAALIAWPEVAPWPVGVAILTALLPLAHAQRAARGTALGAAVAWAGLAVALGLAGQVVALREPLESGRPVAGHLAYLAVLAVFATLLMVLNARRPGAGAWAILMALLVLVFLIPWLEGSGLGRRTSELARLRLEMPWSLFFGVVAATGVANYLPTRAGPAALAVGLGLGLELAALVRTDWPTAARARVWSAVPWTLALGVWLAEAASRRKSPGRSDLERAWLWFRDAWGVAWALRVRDRFNRAAESAGWPSRLAWPGVERPDASTDEPPAAFATFQGLTRRFAEPERVAGAARRHAP
jgi:hypothetical protein